QTLAWLKSCGVRFVPRDVPFLTSVHSGLHPSGGGLAMVEALALCFEQNGGPIFYETTPRSFVPNEPEEVVGIRAVARGHKAIQFRAGAVILACGGFEGNAEMLTRYIGPKASHLRMMAIGSHYNKGEGIRMALDIGAAPCGDYALWHASP